MFPIKGMLMKHTHDAPYIAYSIGSAGGQEVYDIIAAFPADSPTPPDAAILSDLYMNKMK